MQDTERDVKKQPWMHQKENADNLAQAEVLLKDLFMDVDKAKKLQHPQARDIEKEWVNSGASQSSYKTHTNISTHASEHALTHNCITYHAETLATNCHFHIPFHWSPPGYASVTETLLCLLFSAWEISTTAGWRTVLPTGNCMTRCNMWTWHKRSTGVLCWMKNWSVHVTLATWNPNLGSSSWI